MAVGPDLGPGARVVEERVAGRWAPVPFQPQHLSREIIEPLCVSWVGQTVASRKIDLIVLRAEGDPTAEMAAMLLLRGRHIQDRRCALQGRRVRRQASAGQPGECAAPTPADGTRGNPPGTAAGRAIDRATGSNTTGANPSHGMGVSREPMRDTPRSTTTTPAR
jgi:hypothetical protein